MYFSCDRMPFFKDNTVAKNQDLDYFRKNGLYEDYLQKQNICKEYPNAGTCGCNHFQGTKGVNYGNMWEYHCRTWPAGFYIYICPILLAKCSREFHPPWK